ncbi:MAG TPA: hypothetical protein VGN36_01595 [Sphingorhabdus sp.]|jgi:hypothetical protein|nr:hypothetical protein [Sphingorhabdus sp.]
MLVAVNVAVGGILALVMVMFMGVMMMGRGTGPPILKRLINQTGADVLDCRSESSGEPV